MWCVSSQWGEGKTFTRFFRTKRAAERFAKRHGLTVTREAK